MQTEIMNLYAMVIRRSRVYWCITPLYRKKLHAVYPMLYKPTLKNSKN